MDIYLFVLWLVTITGLLFMLGLFLWFFGIRPQTRKLIEETKKLQLKLNQIKSEMQGGSSEEFVSGALGQVGIEGIIDALGIPAVLKPVAKGFIDNLMKDPEKIKALAQQFGVKLPGETSKQESSFL